MTYSREDVQKLNLAEKRRLAEQLLQRQQAESGAGLVADGQSRPPERPVSASATLAREPGHAATAEHQPPLPDSVGDMQFSLFYFSSNEAEYAEDKYRLVIEGARFADERGFAGVWLPERHFHAVGGLFPNPSVLGAALAMVTRRIRIRSGSVVLPLHHPLRVAEEWSVVDNLSKGRVELSFVPGWNPNDFVFAPDSFHERWARTFESVETVRKLWRGEAIALRNGLGQEARVSIYPLPAQRELPTWITTSARAESFIKAGEIGANVIAGLLIQNVEELGDKIRLYREARARSGHDPRTGRVALMLHAFIAEDMDTVRATVYKPFTEYMKTVISLWSQGVKNLQDLSPSDQKDIMDYAFERYFREATLFRTPATALELIARLARIGVNELACLIDFGIDFDATMRSLDYLDQIRLRCNATRMEVAR